MRSASGCVPRRPPRRDACACRPCGHRRHHRGLRDGRRQGGQRSEGRFVARPRHPRRLRRVRRHVARRCPPRRRVPLPVERHRRRLRPRPHAWRPLPHRPVCGSPPPANPLRRAPPGATSSRGASPGGRASRGVPTRSSGAFAALRGGRPRSNKDVEGGGGWRRRPERRMVSRPATVHHAEGGCGRTAARGSRGSSRARAEAEAPGGPSRAGRTQRRRRRRQDRARRDFGSAAPPNAGAVAGDERPRRRVWSWLVADEAEAGRFRREGPPGRPAAAAVASMTAPIEGGLRGVAAAEREARRHRRGAFPREGVEGRILTDRRCLRRSGRDELARSRRRGQIRIVAPSNW